MCSSVDSVDWWCWRKWENGLLDNHIYIWSLEQSIGLVWYTSLALSCLAVVWGQCWNTKPYNSCWSSRRYFVLELIHLMHGGSARPIQPYDSIGISRIGISRVSRLYELMLDAMSDVQKRWMMIRDVSFVLYTFRFDHILSVDWGSDEPNAVRSTVDRRQ